MLSLFHIRHIFGKCLYILEMKASSGSMFKGSLLIDAEGQKRVLISSEESLLDRLVESIGDWFKDVSTGVLIASKQGSSIIGHSQEMGKIQIKLSKSCRQI